MPANLHLTEEEHAKLTALNATFRTQFRTLDEGRSMCTAFIVDKRTGEDYADIAVDDPDEEQAVHRAIEMAHVGERPQTSSEIAQENAKLRARLAELEAGAGNQAATATATDVLEDGLEALKSNDLASQLVELGVDVPDGDRRSNEWRAAAIAMIRDAKG